MDREHKPNVRIDHVAIAVDDIDTAIATYCDGFGFKLRERRETQGKYTSMRSAEIDAGGFSIVLIQGTSAESQVCRYIEQYGPGVQHIAVEVDDVEKLALKLANTGVEFATDVIRGAGLIQIFTRRDANSGMMFEFIQRVNDTQGFEQGNIQQLFNQLEAADAY